MDSPIARSGNPLPRVFSPADPSPGNSIVSVPQELDEDSCHDLRTCLELRNGLVIDTTDFSWPRLVEQSKSRSASVSESKRFFAL